MSNVKDPKEICIHQYDNEDKWSIEIYNNTKATTFAKRCGMTQVPTTYDGTVFEGTTEQMTYFMRLFAGEEVRVPKRVAKSHGGGTEKSEALDSSPQEEKPRRRQKMKRRTRRNVQKEA